LTGVVLIRPVADTQSGIFVTKDLFGSSQFCVKCL
jgi:hypothetical protein